MNATPTLAQLRRFAIARTLFAPTALDAAIQRLGFLQADPIRAPARAQDLILRPRVSAYKAGELERVYAKLAIEEDFFVNYGFVPSDIQRLMHPRKSRRPWSATSTRRAKAVLAFVEAKGEVHPREVDAHFAHGSVINYWGGTSNATTHLLDAMHYRGMLRIVRRDRGVRVYAPSRVSADAAPSKVELRARLDRLIDVIVGTYAPLPLRSLNDLLSRMRYATPQWLGELKPAMARAKERLSHAQIDGVRWYWPADEALDSVRDAEPRVQLLAPFDPLVWDRRRFELFWGWAYRFEAYTPAARRRFGYYALPLLWREEVIGWANLAVAHDKLSAELGYVRGRAPRERGFRDALDRELTLMRAFLGLR